MVAMSTAEFLQFSLRSKAEFAKQHQEDTGDSLPASLEKADAEFDKHLPQGQGTAGHYFYHLKNEAGLGCGYLWYGLSQSASTQKIFIFDILIELPFRGKGFSKFMLQWLETETKALGLNEISLHVLGYNNVARNLYDSMGFEVTNVYMSKKI